MRPQTVLVRVGETEEEVSWKARAIAFYLLIQALHGYAIEFGEVCIQDDFLAAKTPDFGINALG